ncbi:MAG: cardiolipin synthase [Clostridia bacterium]|nr:cardiolipin synthase [Clostridia bacterium]
MKKTLRYSLNGKEVERQINYIPVRYIFAFLITLLEILAIIGAVVALCYYVPYFYLAAWATEIGCVIKIISSDDNPDHKIPWLLFVLILPVAGFMLYFLFSSRKLQDKFIRKLKKLKNERYSYDDSAAFAALKEQDPVAHNQARLLRDISESRLFTNTKQAYFPLGEQMFAHMLTDLQKAKTFIFMEYFIIEHGVFWDSILEILQKKAADGLDVRVVFDDIGCMSTLPGDYAKQLKKFGIKATPFSRLRGNADSEFNNRNHRKILVIDGHIGYTGGVNIADEYINEIERFGHWKDTAVRLEGEAVKELTRLFLLDYGINVKNPPALSSDVYPSCSVRANGYMLPFGDGPSPLYERRVGKTLLQTMLASATEYAYMTTPYLILDNDLCQSIENAALRGVDVRIILPHIPDKKMVFAMTRSFYPRLMRAGVKIYEYEKGFVHAKSYLIDGKYAMLGTINLDYRSLVHHFENGVWFYGCDCIRDLQADMEDTLSKCVAISPDMIKTNFIRRFFRAIVRIFAPLL